tara:strand:+ start:1765 stop:1959 length:195 start_codon:yes stop_codon:yes gene_type:complete
MQLLKYVSFFFSVKVNLKEVEHLICAKKISERRSIGGTIINEEKIKGVIIPFKCTLLKANMIIM